MSLQGKVVVITGAAGRLGTEFTRAVSAAGGIAVGADLRPPAGSKFEWHQTDITKKGSVQTLIAATDKRHGRIDALVNNAYPRGANYGREFFAVEYEDFCANLSMHLGGYFLCAQQFADYFKRQRSGNILNLSSIYGVVAPRFEIYEGTDMTMPVEYAAIKSGVIHLTRYMAAYLGPFGIRVNALSPGGIKADQPQRFQEQYRKETAGKGLLDASDLAGALVFLLSDASRHITGQNLIVDDGFTL